MPQHTGPIKRLIDPFSIPAQMNNIGVLIIAYVTIYLNEQTQCVDPIIETYLYFILYGSSIVCFGTLLLTTLYMLGVIDFCFNKVIPCGEVCLTLNTLLILGSGVLYHFIATLYGVKELIWGQKSVCTELEMFKLITCYIYLTWFVVIIGYVLFSCYRQKIESGINTLNRSLIEV